MLSADSLLYREPALYDEMCSPDVGALVRLVERYGRPEASSVLDLGCGTGRFLAELPERFGWRVGADVQPGMVDYARHTYRGLDVRVADVRRLRLGVPFDVVTCLGFTLSYLHSPQDLAAAAATMAAHTDAGSMVVVHTMTRAPSGESSAEVCLRGEPVRVSTRYEPAGAAVTMHRVWCWPDGRQVADVVRRRVWSEEQLRVVLAAAGLAPMVTVGSHLVVPAGSNTRPGRR